MDASVGVSMLAPYVLGLLVVVSLAVAAAFVLRTRLSGWTDALGPAPGFEDAAASLWLLVALAIVVMLGSANVVATIGWFLRVPVNAAEFYAAAAVALAATFGASRSLFAGRHLKAGLLVAVVVALAVGAALMVAGHFYDVSWDGNTTHQVAAMRIAQGWNPVTSATVPHPQVIEWLAVQYYAKGTWINDAVFYSATGRLEQAKATNLLLIVASCASWISLLLTLRPRWRRISVPLGVLVGLNPISAVQAFTFLVDGQIAALVSVTVAFGCLSWTRLGRWWTLVGFGSAIVLLSNVKFTGLVFAVVLCAGFALAAALRRPELPRAWAFATVVAALVCAVGVVGFNPYVMNTIQHGTPFYPLIGGASSVDIMTSNEPADFVHMGGAERLFRSVFGQADAVIPSEAATTVTRLKIPFTLSSAEVRAYLSFGTTIAGLGPWFGGAVLLAFTGICWMLVDPRMRSSALARWGLFSVGVVAVSALVNPQAWWARYSPQLWLVPVLVGVLLLAVGVTRSQKVLGATLCAALALNLLFVAAISFANVEHGRREVTAGLDEVASYPHGVLLQQREFQASWVKFAERGIRYRIVPDGSSLAAGHAIPYLTAVIAPAP